jgi:RAP1 GTPase activating protein 1
MVFGLYVDAGAIYMDSDTGLESMSSAEATTKACSLCTETTNGDEIIIPSEIYQQIDGLKTEVTRLKLDKLDLLRQNVVSLSFWCDLNNCMDFDVIYE